METPPSSSRTSWGWAVHQLRSQGAQWGGLSCHTEADNAWRCSHRMFPWILKCCQDQGEKGWQNDYMWFNLIWSSSYSRTYISIYLHFSLLSIYLSIYLSIFQSIYCVGLSHSNEEWDARCRGPILWAATSIPLRWGRGRCWIHPYRGNDLIWPHILWQDIMFCDIVWYRNITWYNIIG